MNIVPPRAVPLDPPKLPQPKRTVTVPFANPGNIKKGYVNATFDIEYALIQCSGELHVAYSVLDNSVRQKKPGYYLEGRHYRLDKPAPSTITSVPIKGVVYNDRVTGTIGRFADDHAAKALGFGCFTGQSKFVAKLADLKVPGSQPPSKEALAKYIDTLSVKFETPEVLTSIAVEAEIRAGKAEAGTAPGPGEERVDAAAEERARRAAISAEKQAKYERELAAHQQALAAIEQAKAKMEADKAANAARAKAVQEAFARQQAAHAAEVEANRKLQEEYQAKLRAMQPQN